MQIKLKELLENMTGEGNPPAAPENTEGGGVVEATVQDGPSVASACPPTPRRPSSAVMAAIDAASIDVEAREQADFFNPPVDQPRTTTELDAADVEVQEGGSHRSHRRTTPPPPPPRRDDDDDEAPALAIADQPTAPANRSGSMETASGEDEYEPQTYSPGMLSPLSRRPSGVSEAVKPPRRDSGLIDVRSMAAAYREYDGLAKKQKGERGVDVETLPLPILGNAEHTSPILLPQPTAPSNANRWLYLVVAVLAAIVVIGSTVAITALILKKRDGGGQSFAALSPSDRAALCEAEADRVREDEERIAAARRAPAPVPGVVAESEDVSAADVAAVRPTPTPTTTPTPASSTSTSPVASSSDDDRHHRRHDDDSSSRSGSRSSTSSSPAPSTSATPASTTPAPTPPPAKPAATDDLAAAAGSATGGSSDEKCDEVECLVSGRGCCGKNPKGAGAKTGEAAPPDPNLPQRPERSDISAGIASVQNRLQSCGDRHSVRGAVTVKISIAPSGEVKSATTSQGSAEFQSCLAGALKGAKFPATQQGAKVSYPVMLK